MALQSGERMKEFEDLFLELSKHHDNSVVFNDFLSYCVDMFRIDDEDKHFPHERYNKEEYAIFYELFRELVNYTNIMITEQGKGFYDMLGVFYQDIIQSKWKAGTRGQFFTPMNVSETLAELTVDKEDEEVYKVLDCACGSSRTLLAYHTKRPYDICIGQDLDRTSCLMSVINFVLHGVKGVIYNMNSLTGEFFGVWRVNEYVDYGLPMTVEFSNKECAVWDY